MPYWLISVQITFTRSVRGSVVAVFMSHTMSVMSFPSTQTSH